MSQALQFIILTTAGWPNRQQEDAIDYLREENRVLREHLDNKRIRFTDGQRRRLAVRGNKLGRKMLAGLAGIATPDTILRWYRQLIAKKYDGSTRRGRGRPITPCQIAELVVRMATDNPGWGYTRITPIKLPPRSPNLNAYAERFVRSIKEERLGRVVVLGERHLRLLVRDYVEHYHRERNHQGLGNQLLGPVPDPAGTETQGRRRTRVGGLLNYYHREAA